MLTINLLPAQKRAKVANVEKQAVLFVLTLILIVICMFLIQQRVSNKVTALENKKDSHVNTLENLQPKIDRINEIENTLSQIKNKLNVIKQIRTKQSLPIQYLNNLVQKLPSKKIWFDSLQMDSQGDINLAGVALDNQAFAGYVKDLKSTPYIKDIIIKQTSRKRIKDLDLISFRCSIKSKSLEKNATSSDGKNG